MSIMASSVVGRSLPLLPPAQEGTKGDISQCIMRWDMKTDPVWRFRYCKRLAAQCLRLLHLRVEIQSKARTACAMRYKSRAELLTSRSTLAKQDIVGRMKQRVRITHRNGASTFNHSTARKAPSEQGPRTILYGLRQCLTLALDRNGSRPGLTQLSMLASPMQRQLAA
jgi:hypothetical protein